MGVIDEVLEANEIYSRTHELRRLTPRPARQLATSLAWTPGFPSAPWG
jgi:hypothetical protein